MLFFIEKEYFFRFYFTKEKCSEVVFEKWI